MLFTSWQSLARTLLIGLLAYVALIALLRASGSRTLSKMNAFDLIVTVALGSTLASALLSKNIALADAVLAFALLIGLQFAITWSSVRIRWVRRVVTGEPRLLMHRGEWLDGALRRARVTRQEVLAALRQAGLASVEEAEAVVLETDGSFSVVRRGGGTAGPSSLRDIPGI